MIYLNSRAEDDLVSILIGLLTWEKHFIELEHATSYIHDIRMECYSLGTKNIISILQLVLIKNLDQKYIPTTVISKPNGTSFMI